MSGQWPLSPEALRSPVRLELSGLVGVVSLRAPLPV